MAEDNNYAAYFEEIKTYSLEHVTRLVTQGLAHGEQYCTELQTAEGVGTEDREAAEAARQYLLEQRRAVIETYTEAFKPAFTGEKVVEEAKDDTLSLSLVEDDTLEEMLILGKLAGRIEEHYELYLKSLKRGLVRLSKKLGSEPDPDALAPKKLLLLLQEQLKDTDLSLAAKRFVYDAYGQIMEVELQALYDGVLALLQECNVISESENPASQNFQVIYEYRRQQTGGGSPAPAAGPAEPPPAPDPGGAPGQAPPAGPAVGGGPAGGVPVQSVPYTMQAPAPLAPVSAQSINPSMFTGSEISQALYSFLSRAPAPQTDASGAPLPTVESRDLLKVLSGLQNLSSAELAQAAVSDSASISNRINETITAKTREWSRQLSAPEANIIELVNSMFISILDDPGLIDHIKVQIGRLQIPYIKVALLDVTLLNESAHPARLLLNEIARQGVRVNSPDEPLMGLIQSVVREIIDGFETDLNVFTHNLERLRKAAEESETSASEAEEGTREKAESQAKVLHVKKHVVLRLRQYLKGKILPRELHGLLLKGFAPLLLRIYRGDGEDSDRWRRNTYLLRQIVESVQPRQSAYQLTCVLERSPALLEGASEVIEQLPPKLADNKLVDGLKTIYRQLAENRDKIRKARPEEPAAEKFDPLDFEPDSDPGPPPELLNQPTPEELLAQLPEQIHAGTWCEVYIGRNEPPRRLKVSSVLRDTAQLVFVDSTGEQAEIKDIQEFLDELDCERSRVIPDEQLFDKALTAVINNMNLMRAVS